MPGASKITADHRAIRRWAEAHGGRPATVRGTARGDEAGVLRIDFAERQPDDDLEDLGGVVPEVR